MKCVSCWFLPVILSGVLGVLTGNVAESFGMSHATAYTWAGIMGYMGGSAFQYALLLVTYRYSKPARLTVKVN